MPSPAPRSADEFDARPVAATRSVRGRRGGAVVVGVPSDIPRVLAHPAVVEAGPLELAGVVSVENVESGGDAEAEELERLIRTVDATVVLVAGPLGRGVMRAVSDVALVNGCRLLAVMPSEVVAEHRPVVVWPGAAPLVQLAEARRSGGRAAVKRAVDVMVAALALIVLAPMLAMTAVAIRLDSRGPALFRHRRIGLNGKPFDCLKFRSMQQGAEAILAEDASLRALYRHHGYKLPEQLDIRVTRIGRLIRVTSIDELPQLVNVLRGEMSLVGPRPVVAEELEHYRGAERLLLSVRPGMTGAWAVSGRHHVRYPARADLELDYVRGWSLRTDLRILFRTARAVVRR